MQEKVKIDGSMGEGGGQVLRTSLSLSAITGTEIVLENIRAGRAKPGLKRQHLTCVKAAAEICGAQVSEVEVGSRELTFVPGPIKAGDYRFDVGTAGSVTLVAQTVIPVLLKADGPSTVTITGGTHVPFAPIWEFFELCYLPELRRMGAKIEAELDSCGFYPAAGGVVKLRIWPFKEAANDYALTDLGAYKGGSVVGVVSGLSGEIAEAEAKIVANHLREWEVVPEVRAVSSFGPGNYCYAKLDYERASVVFSSVGTFAKSRKSVANEVVQAAQNFLRACKACEQHLADQLLVPAALFDAGEWKQNSGTDCKVPTWKFAIQKETLHYTTNQAVIRLFRLPESSIF